MNLSIIILAAGQGTRMKSALPKVLHRLAGRSLLEHVIHCAHRLGVTAPHVVYGHGGNLVPQALAHLAARWVEQDEQLGTGHAVAQVMPAIDDGDTVLVLYGDVPLIRTETLHNLLSAAAGDQLCLLTVDLARPDGYGRIVRDANGQVARIVEQKDADPEELGIHEVNTGMIAVGAERLRDWLARLDNDNAQREYYLTDIIAMAVAEGIGVNTVQPASVSEVTGVNDRVQLAALERSYQAMNAEQLMKEGVSILDPARFDLRGELQAGRDVSIDINVIIKGQVSLGDRVSIGPNVILKNVSVGNDVRIEANCMIEDATIGNGARIGPFARIRPETRIADNAHIGNFVEIKKSEVGAGSKINHLSYIGDTTVGKGVNIGAGTITCNYDGARKHRTVIGDNAFIGSNSQLIAPVEIGAGATIGAGSTITRDAPAGELTLGRAEQSTVKGWKRQVKKED